MFGNKYMKGFILCIQFFRICLLNEAKRRTQIDYSSILDSCCALNPVGVKRLCE
jgi:hypothetical protein